MSKISNEEFLKVFNEEQEKIIKSRKGKSLSADELSTVVGGVGNSGEGTCWKCGKPAKWNGKVWFCHDCHSGNSLDDAETIWFIKKMEGMVGKDYILERDGYPVWWNDVVKD